MADMWEKLPAWRYFGCVGEGAFPVFGWRSMGRCCWWGYVAEVRGSGVVVGVISVWHCGWCSCGIWWVVGYGISVFVVRSIAVLRKY
ncbi:hypothetical protein [Bartonella raoultii]|uniref:hypothetical protein n=1 Tax=Bartonella raoultii TaxID=1457020 RepID=UPI001ABB1C46|nr:hypothetical protein [Bartonella raoultii]